MVGTRKLAKGRQKRNRNAEEIALLLRNHPTRAEAHLWKYLKRRQRKWKHKFAPQVVVCGYIGDFVCESLKLVVEVDGRIHDRKDVRRNDAIRTRRLRKQGWTVIRFRNEHVFSFVHTILALLEETASE